MFIFKKNIFLSFLIIIFILLSFFNLILFFNLKENKKLEVIFLNVGTGNSALVKTKNGKKILIDAGYIINFCQPIDMFPNTYHVENVIRLVKN